MTLQNYDPNNMTFIKSFTTVSMGTKEKYDLYYHEGIRDFVIKMYLDNIYMNDMGDAVGETIISGFDYFDFSKDLFNTIKLFKKSLKTRTIVTEQVNHQGNEKESHSFKLSGVSAGKTFSIDTGILSYLSSNKHLNMSKFVQDAIIEKLQRENK